MGWWNALTPGQGSMMSGVATSVGAIVGVVLASWFFSGKVKTLKEALEASQRMLDDHSSKVSETAAVVETQFATIKTQLGDLEARLSQSVSEIDAQISSLAGSVARVESNTVDLNDQPNTGAPDTSAPGFDARKILYEKWTSIRDDLEAVASDENIDGRTRASFGRIDRRSYYDLSNKMVDADVIDRALGKIVNSAFELWQQHKSGKKAIAATDIDKMENLRLAFKAQLTKRQ